MTRASRPDTRPSYQSGGRRGDAETRETKERRKSEERTNAESAPARAGSRELSCLPSDLFSTPAAESDDGPLPRGPTLRLSVCRGAAGRRWRGSLVLPLFVLSDSILGPDVGYTRYVTPWPRSHTDRAISNTPSLSVRIHTRSRPGGWSGVARACPARPTHAAWRTAAPQPAAGEPALSRDRANVR